MGFFQAGEIGATLTEVRVFRATRWGRGERCDFGGVGWLGLALKLQLVLFVRWGEIIGG